MWLSVLFTLGGAIINLPTKNADKLTFLGFLISFLLSVLVFFAVLKIDFLKYPVIFLAIYFIGDTVITFLKFIANNLLKNNQNFWILLLFLLPVLYLISKKHTEFFNFSLIAGIVISLIVYFTSVLPYQMDINEKDYIVYTGEFYVEEYFSSNRTEAYMVISIPNEASIRYMVACEADGVEKDTSYYGTFAYGKRTKALVNIEIDHEKDSDE